MIPAGYLAKRVALRPEWLASSRVVDIRSVSGCISHAFAEYIPFWRHNGWWLFDSPSLILGLARESSLELTGSQLFYYEVHHLEYDAGTKSWQPFAPEPSFVTRVEVPSVKRLEGYDVVTFSAHTSPECSPLSCNGLAAALESNEHALLPSLDGAKALLEQGRFDHTEPGPFRIFAVYSVSWPDGRDDLILPHSHGS